VIYFFFIILPCYSVLKNTIQYVELTAFFVLVPNNALTGNNFNISLTGISISEYLKINVPCISNLLHIQSNAFFVSSFQLLPNEPYFLFIIPPLSFIICGISQTINLNELLSKGRSL